MTKGESRQKGNSKNFCEKCHHKGICKAIHLRQKQIEDRLQLFEEDVVNFHSIAIGLDEKRFSFPQSVDPCKFVGEDEHQLLEILRRQDELLHDEWKHAT